MSGQSRGPALLTSSRPSTSSQQPWSLSTGADGHLRSTGFQDSPGEEKGSLSIDEQPRASSAGLDAPAWNNDGYGDRDHARKRAKHSGGFLLPSAVQSGLDLLRNKSMGQGTLGRVNGKGKAKEDGEELSVQKRRNIRTRQHIKPSIGGSPLANEVVNANSTKGSDQDQMTNGDKTASAPSRASQSIRSSASSHLTGHSVNSDQAASRLSRAPALGFDTDPAQIVNLALSLSESRRRNLSGSLQAPINTLGDRRVISAGPLSAGLSPYAGGGSLRQHLEQQRRISKKISPQASKRGSRATPSPQPSQASKRSENSPIIPNLVSTNGPDLSFTPSDATLSRAEKARVALELGFEYRRLLQYLPKIPLPSESRPLTARVSRKANAEHSSDLGRPYNPLQYVRNRKVRLRERRPLDPENQGWKDVDKVRSWVNTVADEREAGISTIDDRFPLPPFEGFQNPSAINGPLNQEPLSLQVPRPANHAAHA